MKPDTEPRRFSRRTFLALGALCISERLRSQPNIIPMEGELEEPAIFSETINIQPVTITDLEKSNWIPSDVRFRLCNGQEYNTSTICAFVHSEDGNLTMLIPHAWTDYKGSQLYSYNPETVRIGEYVAQLEENPSPLRTIRVNPITNIAHPLTWIHESVLFRVTGADTLLRLPPYIIRGILNRPITKEEALTLSPYDDPPYRRVFPPPPAEISV